MPKKPPAFSTSGRKTAPTTTRKRNRPKKTKRPHASAHKPPAEQQRPPLTVKLWIYIKSGGDGSAYPCFFATEADAETCAADDNERFNEDIREHTFTVDAVTGRVIKGLDHALIDDPDEGQDD